MANHKSDKNFIRIGKYLNEIVTVTDEGGKELQKLVKPVMFEFYWRDVIQVIVGATILAIPVGFTEEVWTLGENLPWVNIFALIFLSIGFIATFVYHNYYRTAFKHNIGNFLKRVTSTYILSIIVVAVLMTAIGQVDWINLLNISLKKVLIVSFPASMSAVVTDVIK